MDSLEEKSSLKLSHHISMDIPELEWSTHKENAMPAEPVLTASVASAQKSSTWPLKQVCLANWECSTSFRGYAKVVGELHWLICPRREQYSFQNHTFILSDAKF